MARLSHAAIAPSRSASNPELDLNRLLARLRQGILQADADREKRLRTSEHERNKLGINLQYARTLLTRLEHDALDVKILSRRQEMQGDLVRKRDLYDRIVERFHELEEMGAEGNDVDNDDDNSSSGEDLLAAIIQTPDDSVGSSPAGPIEQALERQEGQMSGGHGPAADGTGADTGQNGPQSEEATRTSAIAESQVPGTSTTQMLRSRTAVPTDRVDQADASGRERLFGDRKGAATTAVSLATTTEAILDHHRAEQDKLTESLLSMAVALKSSSKAFSTSIEEEKNVLDSAAKGLDKSERGLDAASRRMGLLRKMTEGKGWWGRMILYAWVFGLMLVAMLVVFVMPKLRF